MALKLKLSTFGRKKKKFYRLVVAEEHSKRNGRFIAYLGSYDLSVQPPKIDFDRTQVDLWIKKGALPTETVRKLLNI
jgi:small subunit ribosomal protein S16